MTRSAATAATAADAAVQLQLHTLASADSTADTREETDASAEADAASSCGAEVLWQDDFEDLDSGDASGVASCLNSFLDASKQQLQRWLPRLKLLLLLLLAAGYAVYFCFAIACERLQTEGSVRLLVLTCCGVALATGQLVSKHFGDRLHATVLQLPLQKLTEFRKRHPTAVAAAGTLAFLGYFCGCLVTVGVQNARNLVSGLGVFVMLAMALLLSAHPTRVNWRPVMGGLTIQITFALLLLRTQFGFRAFSFLGDRVSEFIAHADAGAEFVFGQSFRDHFFAFSVLSVVVFLSSFIAVLFHLGVLQVVIQKLGCLMEAAMGTTAGESMVAAANIFIGMTEAPLLVRPFIGQLTNSELHSIISCGYATIAGGVMAAYIGLGVPARHLLSASVMMAPGALAVSKILYPETKKSRTNSDGVRKLAVGKYHNVVDAIGTGAMNAIPIVAAIAVNLISFISMLRLLNSALTWLGARACVGVDLTFELLCGHLLWPIAFVIGVDPIDCARVAELIGTKFVINEFVAYQKFAVYRQNYETFAALVANGSRYDYNGVNVTFPELNATLTGGLLFHERSVAICTFALCGFANISTIGMQLGTFGVMVPKRRAEIVPLVLRGVITGTLTNLLTACIAGIFFEPGL